MHVRTLGIEYKRGGYETAQGVGKYTQGKKYGDKYYKNIGNGWGLNVEHSELILLVEADDGQKFQVRVDHFFKSRWGRLTEKRRKAIQLTMPMSVEIHEEQGEKGAKYLVVLEQDLVMWLARCQSSAV